MARLRRFLMLERARGERDGADGGDRTSVSARFGAVAPPPAPSEPAPHDPFAPPPEPDVALEVDAPERQARPPDAALVAEIDRMAARREEIGVAAVEPRYARQVDRLAALIAVGPLSSWSPRARVLLVAGVGAVAIAALFFASGIGPRVLQASLALLLFALFVPS
ncbi:MAG TPA: hypothetical protein VIG06_15575 [Kofleriaceae bacterium]